MNSLCSLSSNGFRKTVVYGPIPAIFHYLFNAADAYTNTGSFYVYNNSISTVGAGSSENIIATVQPTVHMTGYTGASSSKASIMFNGSNTYTLPNNYSVCFWFYNDNTGGTWVFNMQNDKNNVSFNIGTGGAQFGVRDFFNSSITGFTTTLNYNQWYHYAIVADRTNNTLKYYINGSIINLNAAPYSYSFATGVATTSRFSLGYSANSAGGFYQDARFYDYAITQAYVQSLYNNGNGNSSLA
jgi:hypothetical protein